MPGLKQGDIITGWDGNAVAKFRDLPRLVAATEAGKAVDVAILREGKEMTLSVTTGSMPTPEKVASLPAKSAKEGLAGTGITVADLDPAARSRFGLDEAAKGALVRHVAPRQPGLDARRPGGRRDRARHLHPGRDRRRLPSRRWSRSARTAARRCC